MHNRRVENNKSKIICEWKKNPARCKTRIKVAVSTSGMKQSRRKKKISSMFVLEIQIHIFTVEKNEEVTNLN
jgi:hypothetical protein